MTDKEKISFGALGGPSLLEEDPELFWDRILNDTWSHNEYFDIMCNLFWKKYPKASNNIEANTPNSNFSIN